MHPYLPDSNGEDDQQVTRNARLHISLMLSCSTMGFQAILLHLGRCAASIKTAASMKTAASNWPLNAPSNSQDDAATDLAPSQSQRQKKEVSKAVGAIEHWLPRFDVMVIGPGLGRDAWVHATVTEVWFLMHECNKPRVLRLAQVYPATLQTRRIVQYRNLATLPGTSLQMHLLSVLMGLHNAGDQNAAEGQQASGD